MKHTLVVPKDLIEKLDAAVGDTAIMTRWGQIGVSSTEEMMDKMISRLNQKYEKLKLSGYRREDKAVIKANLNNSGNVSKYLGYFENESGGIDGLFFYNEPKSNNSNDIATRNIWAALLGIYGSVSAEMVDLHFCSRPVYIVNLNETSRLSQRGVKVNIICAMLMGFHYMDMFDNELTDIIAMDDACLNPCTMITDLKHFGNFVSAGQHNEFFQVDDETRTVIMSADKFRESSNPSAELYRVCSRIVPAAYFAKREAYRIDIHNLEQMDNTNMNILKAYLRRFNEQ